MLDDLGLRVKLGSIVVHVEELLGGGHALDVEALRGLIEDEQVQAFLDELAEQHLLPVKR